MEQGKNNTFTLKIISAVTFVIMVIANILGTFGVWNGVTTAEVSNAYPNLFAPAGIAFSIWGVIYALLAIFTVWQFITNKKEDLLNKVRLVFSISSVANTLWIISWSYYLIGVALILIIALLICLIIINNTLKKEGFFLRLPFGIYFGWITIATIANVTTFLVSVGFNGLGLSEVTWTIAVLILGTAIASITMIKNKNFGYGLTALWGYIGILIKHISSQYFAGQYTEIINTVTVCICLLALSTIIALVKDLKRK